MSAADGVDVQIRYQFNRGSPLPENPMPGLVDRTSTARHATRTSRWRFF